MDHKSMEALKQHERVHQLTEALVANVTDLAAKLGEDDPPEVVQQAIYNTGVILAPGMPIGYGFVPEEIC
jgi:hypothetical protein